MWMLDQEDFQELQSILLSQAQSQKAIEDYFS